MLISLLEFPGARGYFQIKLKLKAYHVAESNKGRQMKDIQEHLFLFQLEKGREMDTN